MTYIENIYACLAAPLLIAIICLRGKPRLSLMFILGGMTACLLSSYISSFFAATTGADALGASLEISPVIEEIMKIAPITFWLLVYDPPKMEVSIEIVITAVGFATFENVCYLTSNGASSLRYTIIRGFGTGAMHIVCGMIIALGLLYLWDRLYLRVAGTVGLVAAAITYHAVYNLLVSQTGAAFVIGCIIPVLSVILMLLLIKKRLERYTMLR